MLKSSFVGYFFCSSRIKTVKTKLVRRSIQGLDLVSGGVWGFSCHTFRVTFRSFVKYLLQLDSEKTRPKVVWCTRSFGRVILMGHRSSEPCRLVTWSCFLDYIYT
jgi:hypothetical protein